MQLIEIRDGDKRCLPSKYPSPDKQTILDRVRKSLRIGPIDRQRITSINIPYCGRVYVYSFNYKQFTDATED